jgi:hypothetical protein
MAFQDLDQWTPICPESRQSDVDFEVYAAHVQSKHCERLLKGICKGKPCSLRADNTYPVEFEHIVPRDAGGDSSMANTRLLCSSENRSKRNGLDPYYRQPGFFDQHLHDHKLRPAQKMYGSDQVLSSYRGLFRDLPDELFQVFMVLAWVVGTGKTLGIAGVLLAINQLRREHAPAGWRIQRVLWLVHQDTLIDATGTELGGTTVGKAAIESELVEHGIVDYAPKVRQVRKPEDWILGMDGDIVLATPQSLWAAEGRVLSQARKAQILAGFDAVIVDEGHFAIERYLEICELAPKALKFTMTSTPFDRDMTFICDLADGRYRDRFRLFSAVGLDSGSIHKVLKPVFRGWAEDPVKVEASLARYQQTGDALVFPAIETENYHRVRGGVAKVGQGLDVLHEVNDNTEHLDSIRVMAVVNRCRDIASATTWGYDPHVMLKFGSIRECKFFSKEINAAAERERRSEWGAVEVYAGSKGAKLGSTENPWMLAKTNGGRVRKGSKRIACTVDIGQFGINQPACSIIGWVDTSMSFIEIVQRLGRAVRRRDPMDGDVHVVWDATKDPDYAFTIRLHKAVGYMNELVDRVSAAFPRLTDLNKQIAPLDDFATGPRSLPRSRKLEIVEVIGAVSGGERLPIEQLIEAVDTAIYGGCGHIPDRAREFIETIADPSSEEARELCDRLFSIPQIYTPVRFIREETAPEVFSDGEVADAINRHPDFSVRAKTLELQAYQAGDEEVRRNWQQILHEQRRREYAVPEASYHPREILGVVGRREREASSLSSMPNSYADRLRDVFKPALRHSCERNGTDSREVTMKLSVAINKALQRAAARALGLPDFKLTTLAPVKDQIGHALCCPDVEQAVISLAYGAVMKDMNGHFPGLNAMLSSQISDTASYVNGAVEEA